MSGKYFKDLELASPVEWGNGGNPKKNSYTNKSNKFVSNSTN